jgi:hypothetical protein
MYRDDRRAARLRIEALEARLAEREAELARSAAALAARDQQILRLQMGLGPRHPRSVDAAWATRLVGLSASFTLAAAATGMMLLRPAPTSGVPPMVVVEAPIQGDPIVVGGLAWDPLDLQGPASTTASNSSKTVEVPRQIAQRVWGGRPAADDRRMRHEICSDGDPVCRERARAALERIRDQDF